MYKRQPLYISVDKDVLGPDYARTNWDQGRAGLWEVLACLDAAVSLSLIHI